MLIVRSKYKCGFRPGGAVLLQVGENRLDETTLNRPERAFIDALVKAGAAQIEVVEEPVKAEVPLPPASDTALAADTKPHRERRRRKAG